MFAYIFLNGTLKKVWVAWKKGANRLSEVPIKKFVVFQRRKKKSGRMFNFK
jgi:hypothetical protein